MLSDDELCSILDRLCETKHKDRQDEQLRGQRISPSAATAYSGRKASVIAPHSM